MLLQMILLPKILLLKIPLLKILLPCFHRILQVNQQPAVMQQ